MKEEAFTLTRIENPEGVGPAQIMTVITHRSGLRFWLTSPQPKREGSHPTSLLMPLSSCCGDKISFGRVGVATCGACKEPVPGFKGSTIAISNKVFEAGQEWFDGVGLDPFNATLEASDLESFVLHHVENFKY